MQVHERVLQQIRSSLELPFESENGDLNALNAEELGSLLKGATAEVLGDLLARIGTTDLRQPRTLEELDLIQSVTR
jgi:hypothetical protein